LGKIDLIYLDGTIEMDNPFEKGELKKRLDELTKNS